MFGSIAALAFGVVFGFLIQQSEVVRYDRQLCVLLMEDMTALKFYMTAVAVAMGLFQVLAFFGIVRCAAPYSVLGTNLFGGLLFGIGWAVLGYGPASVFGALGEGHLDGLAGILGMVAGSVFFAKSYPFTKLSVFSWGDLGEAVLTDVAGVNVFLWVICFWAALIGLAFLFEKKDL